MEKQECKNCKICPHAEVSESMENSFEYYQYRWEDVSCKHPNLKEKKIIATFTEVEDIQEPPLWCPLKLKSQQMQQQRKYKTFYEYEQYLRKLEPTTKWEDIEIGKIYHVPPYGKEKRAEWYILDRTNYSLKVKEITNFDSEMGYNRTIFKSSDDCWKLLTLHRLKDTSSIELKIKHDN